MAIAKEIDRGRREPTQRANFTFFRKTSADLCAAILRQNESADTVPAAVSRANRGRSSQARIRWRDRDG
jgi:hypothetical protein